MTQARVDWVKSTIRQMELSGYEPTDVLTSAFDQYVAGNLTFYKLCAVMRDEGE